MRFGFFRTPTKTRGLVVIVWLLILLCPVVNFLHFNTRAIRGDYPPDGDNIGIPILTHALFLYPFEFGALRGLKSYVGGLSLFCFSRRNIGSAILSTLATIFPFGFWCLAMIEDGISAGLYGTTIFFAMRLYAFLLLRAGLMQAYNTNR